MTRLCLFGESSLVEEYAAVLLNRGCSVHARLNTRGRATQPLPRGTRRTATPVRAVDFAMELTNSDPEQKQKNLMELDKVVSEKIPIITSSVTVTLAEQAGWVKHPARLIGLGAFPTFLEGSLVELCTAEGTAEKAAQAVADFFRSVGKETSMVADTTGLVLPRIVCMLVNEAYFAMMEGVAHAREIDTAMKLGTNYPRGPVEWAERIGLYHVHAVLSALHASFGEDRYRVAPLLLRSMRQGAGVV